MNKNKFTACIVVWLTLAGCGYQFATTTQLPAGLQTIHVQLLDNKTGALGIETIFTNDIIFEIIRAAPRLVAKQNAADGMLSGTITRLRYATVAKRNPQESLERLVIVSLDLKLTDRDGAVVWSANDIANSESFFVVADNKLATEKNQEIAIRSLSRRLAEDIYYRLTVNF
jgi:outer membrane lipopolysaccharide assembly protein LptE/RlpB